MDIKKRMMFAKGDDLYYYIYNILILLDSFNCNKEANAFMFHEKLSYLIDLIAEPKLTRIISDLFDEERSPSRQEIHLLQSTYAKGLMRRHILTRLIQSLAIKNILSLKVEVVSKKTTLWLNNNEMPDGYLKSDLFDTEKDNINKLRRIIPRLRTVSLKTMTEKLFVKNGVTIWQV